MLKNLVHSEILYTSTNLFGWIHWTRFMKYNEKICSIDMFLVGTIFISRIHVQEWPFIREINLKDYVVRHILTSLFSVNQLNQGRIPCLLHTFYDTNIFIVIEIFISTCIIHIRCAYPLQTDNSLLRIFFLELTDYILTILHFTGT